jgi:hypothetical protein
MYCTSMNEVNMQWLILLLVLERYCKSKYDNISSWNSRKPFQRVVFLCGRNALLLSWDMSDVGAFQLIKQGNLRVEIHFTETLTATINVIMYAEFDNVIEIDRNRRIESNITANITCVFKVGLQRFRGNLSSVHIQCHTIDLVVFKIERVFRNSPI